MLIKIRYPNNGTATEELDEFYKGALERSQAFWELAKSQLNRGVRV